MLRVEAIKTEGLGDTSYVINAEGYGIVVDPQRDIDRFEKAIAELDIDVRYVCETHIHNDYLTGGPALARAIEAKMLVPGGAAPAYRHRPAFHNESIDVGPLRIIPIHTPGHTPEHVSYLIQVEGVPVAVFSGGSLLVGSAGRSDLLGPDRTDSLARLQFQSIKRLAGLEGSIDLYPTHGAGSFCTSSAAGADSSTIAHERSTNPLLQIENEDDFLKAHLSESVPWPTYYAHMGPINITGPTELPPTVPPVLELSELESPGSYTIVDARPKEEFAAGHIRGSLGVPLRNDFGSWVGWLLPYNQRLVIVLNEDQDQDEAIRQLGRIGFDRIVGFLRQIPSDKEAFRLVDLDSFVDAASNGATILDVRAPNEWEKESQIKTTRCYVPDLPERADALIAEGSEVWVGCETGYRATIAAGILQSMGYQPVVLKDAGIPDVLRLLESQK